MTDQAQRASANSEVLHREITADDWFKSVPAGNRILKLHRALGKAMKASSESHTAEMIMRLFMQIKHLRDTASRLCAEDYSVTDEELEAIFYRQSDELERRMMELPSTLPEHIAAKLMIATCGFHNFVADDHPAMIEVMKLLNCYEENPPEETGGDSTQHAAHV